MRFYRYLAIAAIFITITTTVNGASAKIRELLIPGPTDSNVIGNIGKIRTTPLPDQIEVLVWNSHKFGDAGFWPDLKDLSRGKDLVLLQEAMFDRNSSHQLLQREDLSWTTATSFYVPWSDLQATGVTTGTSGATTSRIFLKTKVKEPITSTPKVALLTTHPLSDGASLMVVNVHAINFVTIFEFRYEMKRLLQVLRKHNGPLLLAGDFNTWAPVREDILFAITKKLGLKTVKFQKGSRTTGLWRVLDHAFVRGLQVVQTYDHSWVTSSDHYPLVFTLKIY